MTNYIQQCKVCDTYTDGHGSPYCSVRCMEKRIAALESALRQCRDVLSLDLTNHPQPVSVFTTAIENAAEALNEGKK